MDLLEALKVGKSDYAYDHREEYEINGCYPYSWSHVICKAQDIDSIAQEIIESAERIVADQRKDEYTENGAYVLLKPEWYEWWLKNGEVECKNVYGIDSFDKCSGGWECCFVDCPEDHIFRVPAELIDTSTGKPKKSDREIAEEAFRESEYADKYDIVGWRVPVLDENFYSVHRRNILCCESMSSCRIFGQERLILQRKQPTGKDLIGCLCYVQDCYHDNKEYAIILNYDVDDSGQYMDIGRNYWKHAEPLTVSEVEDILANQRKVWGE